MYYFYKKPSLIILLSVAALLLAAPALSACDFIYTLSNYSAGGQDDKKEIIAGEAVVIALGADYQLAAEYGEDHRNCRVKPHETVILLQDTPWQLNNESQGLMLTAPIEWKTVSRGRHRTEILFTPWQAGEYRLQIIRDCSRLSGGYNDTIIIQVEE